MEIADDRLHGEAGVLLCQGGGRGPQGGVADIERDVAAEPAARLHGVEQDPRLLAGAGAELDQDVGIGLEDHVLGVGVQDRALGPGRVVLGQAGDLVEQAASPVVVEVDRRELLGIRGQPGAHVGLHGVPEVAAREVDVDGGGDHAGHGLGGLRGRWARVARWTKAPRLSGIRCCGPAAGRRRPNGRTEGRSCGRWHGCGPGGSRTNRPGARTG